MRFLLRLAALLACLTALPAAADELREGGKMVLTGGVSSVEGSAGGGLATWSLIAGNETNAGIGAKVHATYVALPDFDLATGGVAVGFRDRIELSYARQIFDTRKAGATLGLGRGFKFSQDIYGLKVRLIGDAVYDQDRLLPQISVGVQHKRANRGRVITAIGGRHDTGTDFYVAATKVLLSQSLVLSGTVRFTNANQFGLLGFGGDRSNKYKPRVEASAGVMLARNVVVGAEFRSKPSNLTFAREQNAIDLFAAWSVSKRVAITAAYADLGDIATVGKQRGLFLSVQGSF